MKLRQLIVPAIAAALMSGCGDATYIDQTPPAYGAAGQCYYIDDPAEVVALRAAGRCPTSWTPVLMPVSWRNQYAWYYDSPRYYNTYVPVARRTVYVQHVKVYVQQHPQAVVKAPARVPNSVNQKAARSASFNEGGGRAGGDAGTSRVSTRATTPKYTSRAGTGSSFKSGRRG